MANCLSDFSYEYNTSEDDLFCNEELERKIEGSSDRRWFRNIVEIPNALTNRLKDWLRSTPDSSRNSTRDKSSGTDSTEKAKIGSTERSWKTGYRSSRDSLDSNLARHRDARLNYPAPNNRRQLKNHRVYREQNEIGIEKFAIRGRRESSTSWLRSARNSASFSSAPVLILPRINLETGQPSLHPQTYRSATWAREYRSIVQRADNWRANVFNTKTGDEIEIERDSSLNSREKVVDGEASRGEPVESSRSTGATDFTETISLETTHQNGRSKLDRLDIVERGGENEARVLPELPDFSNISSVTRNTMEELLESLRQRIQSSNLEKNGSNDCSTEGQQRPSFAERIQGIWFREGSSLAPPILGDLPNFLSIGNAKIESGQDFGEDDEETATSKNDTTNESSIELDKSVPSANYDEKESSMEISKSLDEEPIQKYKDVPRDSSETVILVEASPPPPPIMIEIVKNVQADIEGTSKQNDEPSRSGMKITRDRLKSSLRLTNSRLQYWGKTRRNGTRFVKKIRRWLTKSFHRSNRDDYLNSIKLDKLSRNFRSIFKCIDGTSRIDVSEVFQTSSPLHKCENSLEFEEMKKDKSANTNSELSSTMTKDQSSSVYDLSKDSNIFENMINDGGPSDTNESWRKNISRASSTVNRKSRDCTIDTSLDNSSIEKITNFEEKRQDLRVRARFIKSRQSIFNADERDSLKNGPPVVIASKRLPSFTTTKTPSGRSSQRMDSPVIPRRIVNSSRSNERSVTGLKSSLLPVSAGYAKIIRSERSYEKNLSFIEPRRNSKSIRNVKPEGRINTEHRVHFQLNNDTPLNKRAKLIGKKDLDLEDRPRRRRRRPLGSPHFSSVPSAEPGVEGLVKKIKSSLENGFPLKRITILDPYSVGNESNADDEESRINRGMKKLAYHLNEEGFSSSSPIPREPRVSFRDRERSNDNESSRLSPRIIDLTAVKEKLDSEILERASRISGLEDRDCAIVLINAINSSIEFSSDV